MEATSVNLHIKNFVRPLTVTRVRELLEQTCKIEYFWMDDKKSQCYISTGSLEEAIQTFQALHDRVWPAETGKALQVVYVPKSELPQTQGELEGRYESKVTL